MKFKATLFISLGLHLSLGALLIIQPPQKGGGTTYYVDLINLGGGGGNGDGSGGGGGNGRGGGGRDGSGAGQETAAGAGEAAGAAWIEADGRSVRDLTVEKQFQSSLRYPDREGRKKTEPEKMVSVVRKDRPLVKTGIDTQRRPIEGGLKTGISSGGGGSGGGDGYGTGSGSGPGGGGYFPYAYYVDLLRNRISSSWYSSLVAPGLKGKYVAAVYFVVRRDGSIGDLRLESSSGIPSLDLSARRAIESAAPFAPLPPDFPSQYLVVHFEFEWEK
jgi:TonB family protein